MKNTNINLWKFTNNSGKPLIMTMMCANLSGGTNGGVSNSDNTFIQLIPDGTASKNPVIKNGSTVTFTLNWTSTFKDGKSFPTSMYPLSAITSDTFIPVWTKAIIKNYKVDPIGFDAETVSDISLKAFNQAINFIQQYDAYPTSDFAKSFNAALSAANDPSTTSGGTASSNNTAMETAVNKFFASTKSAKNVTFDTYLSAKGYYSRYPFAWAPSGKSIYYLYASRQSGSSKVASYIGTLTVNSPANKDWTKVAGGCIIQFDSAKTPSYLDPSTTGINQNDTSTVGSPITLSYASGLFIDKPGEDVHDISLQGLYVLQSTLTGQSGTDKTSIGKIISILIGSVNGDTVIGYPAPVKGTYAHSAPGDSDPFLYNLLHPKGIGGVIQSIMTIGGMLMMLDFVWQKLKGRKEANNKATEEAKSTAEAEGGPSKAEVAEAKYTEADLAKAKSEGMEQAKAEFDQRAKSQGLNEESTSTIKESLDNTVGTGDKPGNPSSLNEAMNNGLNASEASGKYGSFIENAGNTADKLSEAATNLELIEEEGIDVSESISAIEENAGVLNESITNVNSAMDSINSGKILDGTGSSAASNFNKAVSNTVDETSKISENLTAAEEAMQGATDPGGAAESIKESQELNDELSESQKEMSEAADAVEDVNNGTEEPVEGEPLIE